MLKYQVIDNSTRCSIGRVCNIIRALSIHFVPISDTILANAYEWVLENQDEYTAKDILRDDAAEALVIAATS